VSGFKATSIFFSLANAMAVFIGYGNGIYSAGNFMVVTGSYINTHGWNMPDTAAWTLDFLWPFAGAVAALGLHILTWNINDLSAADVQQAVAQADA
jgi:hypothetical protein